MIENKNNIYFYWKLISIYIIARIFTYYLQIVPVGEEIAVRWDILNPEIFRQDLFGSVYYYHFKPPLWNLILGIFIKIFGLDYKIIGIILHFLNIILSFFTIYYFYLITSFFKLTKIQIYIVYFIFFIFSLGFLYYETYIHYAHLTVFLFAQFSYLYLKFAENHSLKYELYIYFTALLLGLTWSPFSIPFFMFVLFIGFTLIKFKQNILRSFLICCVFILLSLTSSIKNKIEVNVFANNTSVGISLFTILNDRYNWEQSKQNFLNTNDYSWKCNFSPFGLKEDEEAFKKNNPTFKNSHPALTGNLSKLNNVGYIHRSKKCLNLAIKVILKEPLDYLNRLKFIFISSHGHFTFDHTGWDPREWKKYFSIFYDLNDYKYLGSIKVRLLQLYYFLMYSFFVLLTIKNLVQINSNKNKFNKSISSIFLIYAWIIFVIHVGVGYEHERMRHTGHFLHIIFFIILLKHKFNYKNIVQEYFKQQ